MPPMRWNGVWMLAGFREAAHRSAPAPRCPGRRGHDPTFEHFGELRRVACQRESRRRGVMEENVFCELGDICAEPPTLAQLSISTQS